MPCMLEVHVRIDSANSVTVKKQLIIRNQFAGLMCGTIGYIGTAKFVRKIYSTVKID